MTDSTFTTKQVLDFLGARIDSAAPVVKRAVNGVVDQAAHYGPEWVRFRAWELAGKSVYLVFYPFLIWGLIYASYRMAKKASWDVENRKGDGLGYGAGAFIAGLCAIVAILAMFYDFADVLPTAIAALVHPDGLAVQLLIDGVRGK